MKIQKITACSQFIAVGILALATVAPSNAQDKLADKDPGSGLDQLDESSFHGFRIVRQKASDGSSLVVLQKTYFIDGPSFDGGDGPDFDGGDGPDYFDGGDGPDFDGGDGPDYINKLIGSDAADSLVGSDAADSLVGSDAADSLVGSDAADSIFQRLAVSIEIIDYDNYPELVNEIAVGLDRMISWSCEGLGNTGRSSLKATGNEVALVSFAERWAQWSSVRYQSKEPLAVFSIGNWSDDFEALALLNAAGILAPNEFTGSLGLWVEEGSRLNGVTTGRVDIALLP